MSSRGQLRRIRRRALVRCCAGLIIALVLCPFTAPFASYDPNASPVGGLLTQDGSLLDNTGDKALSVAALPVGLFAFTQLAVLTGAVNRTTTLDLLAVRSMVLRV